MASDLDLSNNRLKSILFNCTVVTFCVYTNLSFLNRYFYLFVMFNSKVKKIVFLVLLMRWFLFLMRLVVT